jgi:hypothetical protein
MRCQTRPANDEISMRRKPSFYFRRRSLVVGRWLFNCSHWSFVVGRWQFNLILANHWVPNCSPADRAAIIRALTPGRWSSAIQRLILNKRPTTHDQRLILTLYPGLSRCTTFTRYPAFPRRLLTSSAIITERC